MKGKVIARILLALFGLLLALSFIGCMSGAAVSGAAGGVPATVSVTAEEGSAKTKGTSISADSAEESRQEGEFISYDLHRYALVIGNGRYEEGVLANPVNDADLMAAGLAESGFDVYRYTDLGKSGMDDAIASFVRVVNSDSEATAVFYYAGHGVEVDGVNYLIPVDNGRITTEEEVKIYACSLDSILSLLRAREQIIMLDACRNNPFRMSGDRAAGIKGGLGALKEARKGVTMSYLFAAQSGQTAKDGEGGNSVFTAILAEELKRGNVPISQLFSNVASRVKAMTKGEQVPLSSTTGSSFVFQSEELAKSVLAKWAQQLRKAEADMRKLEESRSTGEGDAAALAEAEAKLALAQAEKEASEKRAAQIEAESEKARIEAEAARSRSAELQERIDAMRMAAENAATQVRMNTVSGSTIAEAIEEIEGNKSKIVGINDQVAALSKSKETELSVEYAKKANEIDKAAYQKAELGADGRPTATALAVREMRKESLKAEYDRMLEEYTAQIASRMKGSDAEIVEIVRKEAEALGAAEFTLSSLTGGIDISIDQYDGSRGGWNMSLQVGSLVSDEIFLPYETLTGKKSVPTIADMSQMADYQEYLDNVDMFDSMFRGEVPVIVVEMKCHVVVGGGTLSYQVVPDSLAVRRIDTDMTVREEGAGELKRRYGNLIIESRTGLDIRSADEIEASTITIKVPIKYRDGIHDVAKTLLVGSVEGGEIVKEGFSPTEEIVIDDYYRTYEIGDRGPAGGWIIYDKGSFSDGWRYLEAAPEDLSKNYKWGDIEHFGTRTEIGTGKKNTELIVSKSTREQNNAARACMNYSMNGYDDWFLPSSGELNLMYVNLHKAGHGGFDCYSYWSSSEYSYFVGNAWGQSFSTGLQVDFYRFNVYRVRPLRAF